MFECGRHSDVRFDVHGEKVHLSPSILSLSPSTLSLSPPPPPPPSPSPSPLRRARREVRRAFEHTVGSLERAGQVDEVMRIVHVVLDRCEVIRIRMQL
jgi:hypothetical protein